MHRTVTIFMVALALFASCKNDQVKSNELPANQIFNSQEMNEIERFLIEFDQEICSNESKPTIDITDCYNAFFERILAEVKSGDYNIGINQERQNEILAVLNPKLKEEIWSNTMSILNRRIINTDPPTIYPDTLQILNIIKRRYFEYLEKEIAPIDNHTQQYFFGFSAMGDISPSLFAEVLQNYKLFNISDTRIRLMIAIHYLTLNDQNIKRKASYDKLYSNLSTEPTKSKND